MNYLFLNKNKKDYISFCEQTTKYIPIFSKPWWLECVTDGNWDVLVANIGGKNVAYHPFFYVLENGKMTIRKAQLTQNNGIIFNTEDNLKYQTKLVSEKKATSLIIDEIKKLNLNSYRQYFHFSFKDWLPFYWESFSQSTRYTYIIDEKDLQIVWAEMNSKLRNEIKKASSFVTIEEDFSVEELYENVKKTFEKQNLDVPYSFETLKKLDVACLEHGCRHFFVARGCDGKVCSCIYLIEDEESVYYLISGSDPAFKTYNSLSLLIMKGIEYAITKGKRFDFEGSMKQNIEKHFAQFGAKQYPYMDIKKDFSV